MKLIEVLKTKIRGNINIEKLIKDGCIIGDNFHAQQGVIVDPGHCWLISIGNNVTLAPNVHILAHDASTKNPLGYTKIGKVTIGNNVFIGAGTFVLPDVEIADNVVVGAGSVVTHDLESGVYAGNPCIKIVDYDTWVAKQKSILSESAVFDEKWKYDRITPELKKEMKNKLEYQRGFIV